LTGERRTASQNGVVTAAVVGAILGGLAGGLALWALTTFHLPFMASIVGVGGASGAFGVWMGAALVMGLLFGSVAEPSIDYFASVSTWLTERIALFRTIGDALPAGNATAVGVLYGLVMGDLVGLIAVPAAVGGQVPPAEAGSIVVGYAVFGLLLGFGYEHTRAGTIPTPSTSFLSPAVRGAVFAPVVAGAVSGVIVYAGEPLYLRYLATIPGYGTLNAGLGVWMALSIVLGLVFAVVAYRHAARDNSTTGYGFVYGVVLAVFVGLLAVPAIVSATTQYPFGFGDVGSAALVGFVVYGLALGSLYGKTVNRRPLRPTFLVGRTRATVISALVAGGVTGTIVYTAAPVALLLLGFLPGPGGSTVGLLTWIGIAVLLGCGFAVLPARQVERQDYPGQTGFKLGLAYGLLVALPVGGLLVPRAVDAVITGYTVAPLTQGVVLGSWVLFGLLYGLTYGAINGSGRVTPLFLQGREVPVFGGAALGGAAGAAVAYGTSVVPGFYLQVLGGAIGVPSIPGGLAVFFGIALLAGVLFVPFGARSIEADPGIARWLGTGAVFGAILAAIVGVYLVPAATVISSPHTNPPVASYFVLGLVFGGIYAVLRRRTMANEAAPTPTAIGSRGQRAIVFGSLFGGAVGGLVMYHMVAPVAMLYFSSLIGYGSYAIGWVVWLVVCLLLGGGFAVAVGPRIDRYVDSIDEFTERDEDLEAVFGERFEHAPLTTTATLAGFVFGLVAAVAVGAIAFPLAVNTMTGPNIGLPVPVLQPYFLLAFLVYGLFLGLGYGVVKEF
jgi:hypothetical protein